MEGEPRNRWDGVTRVARFLTAQVYHEPRPVTLEQMDGINQMTLPLEQDDGTAGA